MNKKLYKKFNQILFLNTFFIIKYLSKTNTKYIAKHICEAKKILPNRVFKIIVEKGDEIDSYFDIRGELQERSLRFIQRHGLKNMLVWIADVALAITELQSLGIYHTDIFFRNTIKITKGKKYSFKIIDFDKAYKIFPTEKDDKSYECTKNLFNFWLRFRFDNQHPISPICDLSNKSESSKEQKSTSYGIKEIICYIFEGAEQSLIAELLAIKQESIFSNKRVGKCIGLLKKHMQVSHLKQYSALVEQLVKKHQEPKFLSIEQSRVNEIFEALELLKKGEIDYTQYAKKIRTIGDIEESSELKE